MLKREGLTWPVLLLGAVLTMLFVAGLFFDYPISCFLYGNEASKFGNFFAAFGELPAFLLMETAGLMLIRHRGKTTKFKDIFFLLGGIAMILQGFLAQIMEMCEDLANLSVVDATLITLVLYLVNGIVTVVCMRELSREEAIRFVLTVLFVCAVSMVAANAAKIPWGRPRMRLLAVQPDVPFVPWYRPDAELKKQFVAMGVRADEFRSFPSGHTVTAACSLLWTLLSMVHRFFEGKGRILFLLSLVWTGLVTVSRLSMGAHFLTDVTFSWLMVWVLYLLSLHFFYRDGWVFQRFYKLFT